MRPSKHPVITVRPWGPNGWIRREEYPCGCRDTYFICPDSPPPEYRRCEKHKGIGAFYLSYFPEEEALR